MKKSHYSLHWFASNRHNLLHLLVYFEFLLFSVSFKFLSCPHLNHAVPPGVRSTLPLLTSLSVRHPRHVHRLLHPLLLFMQIFIPLPNINHSIVPIILVPITGQCSTLSGGLDVYTSSSTNSTGTAVILLPDIYGWNGGQ